MRLGRNNDRSPSGKMIISENPSRILKENLKIYNDWFEVWLLVNVPKLTEKQKWFKNEVVKIGDIVLFLNMTQVFRRHTYIYGIVDI